MIVSDRRAEDAAAAGGTLARNICIAVAIVLIAFIALLATRKTSDPDASESKILGQAVPAVQGTTLDGAAYDIDTHRGCGSW